MIKIQKSKPNRHKIYLLENCPSSINNREVLICNDYMLTHQSNINIKSQISHELRTPLSAILGLVYCLESTVLNQEQQAYVEEISLSVNQLLKVPGKIDDLLQAELVSINRLL